MNLQSMRYILHPRNGTGGPNGMQVMRCYRRHRRVCVRMHTHVRAHVHTRVHARVCARVRVRVCACLRERNAPAYSQRMFFNTPGALPLKGKLKNPHQLYALQ